MISSLLLLLMLLQLAILPSVLISVSLVSNIFLLRYFVALLQSRELKKKTCAQTNRMSTIDWIVCSRMLVNYQSRANCIYCRPGLWSPWRQSDNTVLSLEYIHRRTFPLLTTFHWFIQKCLFNAFPTLLNVSPIYMKSDTRATTYTLEKWVFSRTFNAHAHRTLVWTCTECRIKLHIDADEYQLKTGNEWEKEKYSFDFMRRCYCCCFFVLFSISEKVMRLLSNFIATHTHTPCEYLRCSRRSQRQQLKFGYDITWKFMRMMDFWSVETQKMLSTFRHLNFEFQNWKKNRIQIGKKCNFTVYELEVMLLQWSRGSTEWYPIDSRTQYSLWI